MLGNLLAIALMLAATIAIPVGIRAAWRTRKPLVRWPVAIVGGLFVLIGLVTDRISQVCFGDDEVRAIHMSLKTIEIPLPQK